MSLQDNCSNSNTEPNSEETMEGLLQQLEVSELKNMKLSLENKALKVLMNSKDSKWNKGKTRMQAGIASLESELKNAKVVQRGLESELREMNKRLIVKDTDIQFLNNPPEEPQAVIQRITEELREYKQKVEDVDREKDEVIATFQSEKTALVDKNAELMAKLKTTQTQILQSETDCNLKVNALENQLGSEQLEKDVCVQRIKELEGLVETTEKKWLNVQEDLQKNVELTEKLTAMQTQIHQLESDWELKVNTLEDQLRSEQVEQETCLQIIEELKSLVEATEKKLLNLQEDSQIKSQKMDEDIKFLIVKTIKLQELALMSDSDKARRRKDERKAQKEEEKRLKKELREKKEQEKREKKQKEKEAKKEKRKTTSHLPSPC